MTTNSLETYEGDVEPTRQQTPYDPFFGSFLGALRENLMPGSSEYGTVLSLFSLVVATRARNILEIGRQRGYTTLALAAACKFIEMGWDEPEQNKVRPDVDYKAFEARKGGMVWSVDCTPRPEAEALIEKYGLGRYVTYVNQDSTDVIFPEQTQFDLMFIDGDHTFDGCLRDVTKFVIKNLKPGGYFILHDYFGWYINGKSCSPIMQVVQKCLGDFDQVLIDTGYQSFVLFRKQTIQIPVRGKANDTSGVASGTVILEVKNGK